MLSDGFLIHKGVKAVTSGAQKEEQIANTHLFRLAKKALDGNLWASPKKSEGEAKFNY